MTIIYANNVQSDIRKIRKQNEHSMVFVHGFCNNPEEAISAYSKIEAEISHYYKGKIPVDLYGFIWDSKDNPLAYYKDLRTAKQSTNELEHLNIELNKVYSSVNANAHSMGCFLLMKTLQCCSGTGFKWNNIYLLGGDCIRWRFRSRNSFGKCFYKVEKLISFYSKRDRVLRFVSKLTRPLQKIGNHRMPRRHPNNYFSIDAEDYNKGKKVRHNDYKGLRNLQLSIIKDIIILEN
jgi:esterase/lipase superfamily enzyme